MIDRLEIYAALGVLEVWRYDLQSLSILVLEKGGYQLREQSLALPIMTAEIIQTFLKSAPEMGETSWAKQIRQWVRNQLESTEN